MTTNHKPTPFYFISLPTPTPPGKDGELAGLMKTHLERLKKEDLVTGRKSIIMRSSDGTVVEIFEWKSEKAIEQAHTNPNVMKMWSEFEQVCKLHSF